MEGLREHIQRGTALLLPLAAIYETGNHIAHCPGGGQVRRRVAQQFVSIVQDAFSEDSAEKQLPWVPTPRVLSGELAHWLEEFPDFAMREVGLADLTIIKVFKQQCEMHRARRVFVWSYDSHLQGYDRESI